MAKILIVDDEYTIAETLSEILAYEGFEPSAASNGELGLAALEKSRPDLLLVDYMMPVMDGVKMLRAMRAEPRWARLPAIMMTAAPARALADHATLWDAFLRKPFEADQMVKLVREVLARRKETL